MVFQITPDPKRDALFEAYQAQDNFYTKLNSRPKTITILGMGLSLSAYAHKFVENIGGISDEVWGINHTGLSHVCDKIFLMDDLHAMEDEKAGRAHLQPSFPKRLHYMEKIRKSRIPVITNKVYPEYPASVAYPLQEIIDHFGFGYFNNTVPYAIAYAIYIGVKHINLFGIDYSYPPEDRHGHYIEQGRACTEFWLGYAKSRGITVHIDPESYLMDSSCFKFYGYLEQPNILNPNRNKQDMKERK